MVVDGVEAGVGTAAADGMAVAAGTVAGIVKIRLPGILSIGSLPDGATA
jgi:hypothetical protein